MRIRYFALVVLALVPLMGIATFEAQATGDNPIDSSDRSGRTIGTAKFSAAQGG